MELKQIYTIVESSEVCERVSSNEISDQEEAKSKSMKSIRLIRRHN